MSKYRQRALVAGLCALVLVGTALAVTEVLAPRDAPPASAQPATHWSKVLERSARPVTVAAYGDSITAWIERDGSTILKTWVSHLGPGVDFTRQGWAGGGAKLDEIASHAVPITADVLIIAAGTNDEGDRWGTPMGTRLAEVDAIVVASHPKRVVLDAVPPRDLNPAWSDEWNAQLQQLAAARGWGYFDPWASLRSADGHYLPGTTFDGVHPTPSQQIIGALAITAYLRAAGS